MYFLNGRTRNHCLPVENKSIEMNASPSSSLPEGSLGKIVLHSKEEKTGSSYNHPPLDEIYIHHLPVKDSIPQKRSSRLRQHDMHKEKLYQSAKDLQEPLTSQERTNQRLPDLRATRKRVDLYNGATLTPLSIQNIHTSTAIVEAQQNTTFITIAPGVEARLRGADETYDCINNDFFLPTCCHFCEDQLCCIQDASYILCPSCMTVSPLDVAPLSSRRDGGVGLGFTLDELYEWQNEIAEQSPFL